MQLQGITPKTFVDGFIAELLKHNESIVVNDHPDGALIAYCYEISVTCDGSNPRYSTKSCASVLVTQFATSNQGEGVEVGDEYLPLIILGHEESLGSIEVREGKTDGQQCALAIFSILNTKQSTRRTLAWIVRKSEALVLH